MTERENTIPATEKKKAAARAAIGLERVCALCGRHPVLTLLAAVCIPELFLLVMGMVCKVMPSLLTTSAAILAICVALWAAGLSLWAYALVRRRTGKHAQEPRAKAPERSAR